VESAPATAATATETVALGEPAACESLQRVMSEVDTMTRLDVASADVAVSEVQTALENARTELVIASSDDQLSGPIADLEASLDDLSSTLGTATSDGQVSSEELATLGAALTGVSSSWADLEAAVPDCDL
jgi:hypothetical protein